MLLNKLPILDFGFIAPLEFCGNGRMLQDVQDEFFSARVNKQLLNMSSASFVVKCPAFVKLSLQKFNFSVINTPLDNAEVFIPDVSMINASSLEESQQVHDYLKAASEALTLNIKAMEMDGIDSNIAQQMMPLSTYTQFIVSGKLSEWLRLLKHRTKNPVVTLYNELILDCLTAEWKNINVLIAQENL